ncbi:MFS transporter [Halosegnis marinus]|uniref:MFS transporter n=1 Tax=Halosegnis marinus TaxID=3034023 RepID=A0ABD5ZR77_9EURY|nr:MFS transporter [Halosegnis sp. DT85]
MSHTARVVGLVGGSHLFNHAYLVLLAPAFPYLAADLGVSTAALGLAVGLAGGVVTLLQLPLGYVSDTYSRRLVFAGSLTLGALGAGTVALAPSYAWLLAGQVVVGIGVAGHHPAHYPMLSSATDEERRGRAYSVHGFAGALGLAAPFSVVPAAYLLGYDWRVAFGAVAVAGGLYAAVALVALRPVGREVTHPPDPRPLPGRGAFRPSNAVPVARRAGRGLRAEARSLAGAPPVLLLTLLWFSNSVAGWGVKTYTPALLGGYGLAPADASLVSSAMLGVGAVVLLGGGVLADRVGSLPVMTAGYAALVLVAGTLAWGALPAAAAVVVVLSLSATIDVSRPARSKLTDAASARDDVGKNFALMTVGISAGGAVAPPAFGYVVESVGAGVAFYAVAAVGAVTLALTLAVKRTGLGTPGVAGAPGD